MQYVKLDSEKYLHQKIDSQIKQAKQKRNWKATRDFATFVIGVALIPCCMLLAYQLPVWFPGLVPFVEAWMGQLLPGQIADSVAQAAS